ncbi:MAG: efflux RND transporter periplasmic adaptor subunit, partial [Gammaproteobacteria bacterium]|nr:efflux RND transporter periplasmic adaptor subunit [Gammaproteobacteria bacterium]
MKNFDKKQKSLHYFAWLFVCWLHNFFEKKPNSGARKFGRTVRFGVAVLVVSIPISFYLVQPNHQRFAIADILSLKANKTIQVGSPSSNARKNSLYARNKFKTLDSEVIEQPSSSVQSIASAKKETALDHARKHVDPNYVCPMHSEIVSKDSEATCPICGMNLVLLESGGESGVVSLSPNVVNSLGVRTEVVKRKTLYRRIDSVGYVSVDENSIRTVNLRTEGWIERLAVNTVGERVKKGQLLLEVYSPKLVNAQEEYVQAKALGNDVLIKASSERLRALGVSKAQIRRLKTKKNVQQNIKIYASHDGVISELNVREGMFVKPSKALINMVDLSSVWLLAEVFERQADWVKVGQRAEAYLPYLPDKTWEGKVEYVYPSIDLKTRSLKVRL